MTSRAVWKWPLAPADVNSIQVPRGAKFLAVQAQEFSLTSGAVDLPCVWAEVNAEAPLESVNIYIVGTGHEIPTDAKEYLGTFQIARLGLVFHVYASARASEGSKGVV